MFLHPSFLNICLLIVLIESVNGQWRSMPKRVTAEYGSDLSLSCTFHQGESDETIVQWLYQNRTDNNHRRLKTHWRPLFLNAQSLTPKETRYSMQEKIHQINQTSIAYSTVLTLAKVTDSDEGLYMCKSLSPKTIQMTYQVRVIQSLDIVPKRLIIPATEIGLYSVRLTCILTDNRTNRRPYEVSWWHNNRRLGSQTNRYARIIRNLTDDFVISTLFYTGRPTDIVGNYICESEPLRRSILVALQTNRSANLCSSFYAILSVWIGMWILRA